MNEFKIVIEGMKELAEAVRELASALTTQNNGGTTSVTGTPAANYMNQPVQQPSVPAQVPAGQPQQGYTAAPPTAAAPVSAMPPIQGSVPTTAAPQTFTLEQLQVAAAGLTSMGKLPAVMGILQKFGIQAMTELPRERYGEFALSLREAGAQI